MRKKILLGLIVFAMFNLLGCEAASDKIPELDSGWDTISEYVDQETGVHYLIFNGDNKGGITVRYKADGTIYTTKKGK